MLIEKVRETVEKHALIEEYQHIVLGLSGGPDSMCLFDVLMRLGEKMELKIHPVHVNHGLRAGEADRDQEYVENVCRQRGVECRSFSVDCRDMAEELRLTEEEAGRKARYDAFFETAKDISDSLRKETGCSEKEASSRVRIAVAHNADDQAETVLFRILRGTGVDGISGISYIRREREFDVIRPVLDITRDEIEEYCKKRKLNPVTDTTNSKSLYTRNRIRLELIPMIEREYNENIRAALVRLASIAAEDSGYIWNRAEEAYRRVLTEEGGGEIIMERASLSREHPAVRHRIILRAFARIGLDKDISEERIKAADSIIEKKQASKTVEFPRGYRLTVAKGKVRFYRADTLKVR